MKDDSINDSENTRTPVEKVMLLFVESGFVYSTLWVSNVLSLTAKRSATYINNSTDSSRSRINC